MLALAGLFPASAVAVWLVVGDLRESGVSNPDYLLGPVEILLAVEVVAGAIAVAWLGAVGWWLWRYRGDIDRRWRGVAALSAAAGVVVGVAGRVVTAGVAGANIGGSIALVVAPPAALALLLTAALRARAILAANPYHHGRRPVWATAGDALGAAPRRRSRRPSC